MLVVDFGNGITNIIIIIMFCFVVFCFFFGFFCFFFSFVSFSYPFWSSLNVYVLETGPYSCCEM